MGEIDTKSIESVQASLPLFGEKADQKRSWPACNNLEKEKELEGLLKDSTNYKVQLVAKNSAHVQALLGLEQCQKTDDELFILLKNTELEKEIYVNECREAKTGIDELKSKIKQMDEQMSETVTIRGQLSDVISELKSTREELLDKELELVAARDEKLEVMKQTEMMETSLNMEKEKTGELTGHVTELNETILHLQLAVIEAEKEKDIVLSEKQAELLSAMESVTETQEELESMRNKLKLMKNSENELLEKSLMIESLQIELQRANELQNSAEKATANAVNDINQLIADMELLVRENSIKDGHINSLEMNLSQLRIELENKNEERERLNFDVETITGKFAKSSARENEAQVEIALLQSEIHKARSKTAAAEAAEERARRESSELTLANQALASEAEEAKLEIQRLKEETQNSLQYEETRENDESKTEDEKIREETNTHITISVEEYEALLKKAEKVDKVEEPKPDNIYELEILKKELEITTVRIGEFRTRAEQAACRAQVAENAKAALEERIRRWREQRERRNAALEALKEEAISRKNSFRKHPEPPKIYQPLGKVLNMKF